MRPQSIGFIGAGNIAEALIRGIITSGHLDPGQIVVSDPNAPRLDHLSRTLGPRLAAGNADNAAQSDVLFLTVKPNQVAAVAAEIRPALRPGQFVVSVAAGKSLAGIREALGPAPTPCRIMPNLAAGVRKAVIGLYADPAVPTQSLAPVYDLLSCTGRVFRVEDEHLMAVITALSGSAPAYYVMMAEALIRYGVSQGMTEELATSLILGTMEGSAAWAANSKIPLADLWRKVVTPGGTTEAGMKFYDEHHFINTFIEGLNRSTTRARDLGDK